LITSLDNIVDGYSNGECVDEDSLSKDPEFQAVTNYLKLAKGQGFDNKDTLQDALVKALAVRERRGVSAKELKRYTKTVKDFLDFIGEDDVVLSSIRKRDVMDYVEHLRVSLTDKTVLSKTSKLSNVFKTAQQYEMVDGENPFTGLGLSSKVNKRREVFTYSEAKKVFNALPEDSKLIWQTLYHTGMRPNELFSLQAKDIVFKEGSSGLVRCFSIKPEGDGKTEAATRFIPIHSSLLEFYESFDGFSISQSTFEKRRRKAILSCFDDKFADTHDTYSLRHSFVTTMIDELSDKAFADYLVGHKGSDVAFKHYFHGYKLDKIKAAVELIKPLSFS
jgi:site-specific recombinase XerD